MAKRYYQNSTQYPPIERSILSAVRYYIASVLYPSEYKLDDKATVGRRTLLADMGSGSEVAIRKASQIFKRTNTKLPFTAYGLEDFTAFGERKNHFAKGGFLYCSEYGNYIRSWPMQWSIPMISFFARVDDYLQALSLLNNEGHSLKRLYVPLTIAGELKSLPIDIRFNISKGTYASEFEEYLRVGGMWDIVHTLEISYHDIIFDDDIIYPVDEMSVGLASLDENGQPLNEVQIIGDDTPNVTLTPPIADSAIDIPIDTSIILTFNQSMIESTVEENLSILPFVSADYTWSANSTVLTVAPIVDLANATKYVVEVGAFSSGINIPLGEDFVFSFTTV